MIRSMTGFGDAQREEEDHAYHLEIRSVNNRYLKAAVHLPEDFAFLETDVERSCADGWCGAVLPCGCEFAT